MHDDDLRALMHEDDTGIPEEEELLRRLRNKYTPVTRSVPRGNFPNTWNDTDEPRGVYLQENKSDITSADGIVTGTAENISNESIPPDNAKTGSVPHTAAIISSSTPVHAPERQPDKPNRWKRLFEHLGEMRTTSSESPGASSLTAFVTEYDRTHDPKWQAVKANERRAEKAEKEDAKMKAALGVTGQPPRFNSLLKTKRLHNK